MTAASDFDALVEQLPFYVNGTLEPADVARIEHALQSSPELRKALANEEKLAGLIRKAGDQIMAEDGEPEGRPIAHAAKNLPASPSPRKPPSPPRKAVLAQALSFLTPRRWIPAVALSLAITIGTQATMLSSRNQQVGQLSSELAVLQEKYETAGGPCDDAANGAAFHLELKDEAKWSAVADLLDTEQLRIVDTGGFGTLTLASKVVAADLPAQLARLRNSPLVQSADAAK